MLTALEIILLIATILLTIGLGITLYALSRKQEQLNAHRFESWFTNDKIEELENKVNYVQGINNSLLDQLITYQDTVAKATKTRQRKKLNLS